MRLKWTRAIAIGASLTALAAGCGGDGGGGGGEDGFDDRQIVADYADRVVIPTYELLRERAVALDEAAAALVEETTDENLDAAREAWVAMRVPWEQSEAFLFGPVAAQGWDPAMDDWPLNRDDLDGVLASGDELTQEYIRSLPETQKGFHTVEYLLWGEDSARQAADLTARELEYLVALTEELTLITADLARSWTEGVGGQDPYRDVFAGAGEPGNTSYPSLENAVQEILDGMSGICDEVANGKIAGPHVERDPNLVESQYSFNSLLDFQDNLRGVANAYAGDFPAGDTEGRGLDEWVAERDPDLDARFAAEVQAAVDAIGEIPAPFPDAIQDPANDDVIEAAQDAIRTVQETVDRDLVQLLLE